MVLLPGCPCCGATGCLRFKPSGFTGSLANPTNESTVLQKEYTQYFSTSISLPFTQTFTTGTGYNVTLKIEVQTDVTITISYTDPATNATYSLVLVGSGRSSDFMAGNVVTCVAQSTTFTGAPTDDYGRRPIDGGLITPGQMQVRLAKVTAGECGQCYCVPNQFMPGWTWGSEKGFPDTASLTFTKTTARTAGWRGPSPTDYSTTPTAAQKPGTYARFLPPNDAVDYQGTPTAGTVRTGCHGYLTRFAKPIVMRKTTNVSDVEYMSDPIPVAPQSFVIYAFYPCGYTTMPTAAGSVLMRRYMRLGRWETDRYVMAQPPSCAWDRESHVANGTAYRDAFLAHTYNFMGVASVKFGGTYTPEPVTLCLPTDQPTAILASNEEGCYGTKCPPLEVPVTLMPDGNLTGSNYNKHVGTFVCSLTRNHENANSAGRWDVETTSSSSANPFARGGLTWTGGGTGRVIPNPAFPTVFYDWRILIHVRRYPDALTLDTCGCEARPITVWVEYAEKTTEYDWNLRYWYEAQDPAKTCLAACVNGATLFTWQQFGYGTANFLGGKHMGTIKVNYGG